MHSHREGPHFITGFRDHVISFQSTLWKQQNVIMFSGCIQHYIATIYFHFICLSNTGASAGNCFRLQRVSVHEKIIFFSANLLGTRTAHNFKWIFGATQLLYLCKTFSFLFLLEEAIRETGRLL